MGRGVNCLVLIVSLFMILVALIPYTSADVVSVNSGGTGNIILNPDRYVDGFFFGIDFCGDGTIQSPNSYGQSEQCDDSNTVSGDGCSSTCQTEAVTPPDDGGGGGGGAPTPSVNITVSPEQFNIDMLVSTNIEETITVTNLGASETTISISQQGLSENLILGNTSLTIPAGQSQTFNVVFVALDDPGIVTGKIIVGGHEVLVSLNIKTHLLLFDSNIVVLNENYQVEQGEDLRTLVTLIPMGDPDRLDVTLNFVIKDYNNNIYLTKSETLLVEEQISIRREFSTGILPLGDYIVGLELVYLNGVAPSSAYFEVIEKKPLSLFGRIVLFLIILILLILIIIISILIIRRLRERKEQTGSWF